MVPNCNVEKTTVYPLFHSFIKFSAIEMTSVFKKQLITKNGKKDGVPMLVGEREPFFN